ncbi:MAG: hypothetical protein HY901_16650 [Deltaproteobacteria bacterium]|nr:hypothetical protein [Deltaproteobacteria bacterium]
MKRSREARPVVIFKGRYLADVVGSGFSRVVFEAVAGSLALTDVLHAFPGSPLPTR